MQRSFDNAVAALTDAGYRRVYVDGGRTVHAFLRAGLWKPETWDPEAAVQRRAVLAAQVEPDGRTVDELDEYYGPAYEAHLYG